MKNIIVVLLVTTALVLNAQDITTIKSFPLKGNTHTVMNTSEATTSIEEWNEDFIRIQTEIFDSNISKSLLAKLMKAGFFNLTSTQTDGGLLIDFPNKSKEVMISGKKLIYRIEYKIFIPFKHTIEVKNTKDDF